MFSKLLGKKDSKNIDNKVLADRIEAMNLTELRSYINNKIADFKIDEDGLNEVMKKMLKLNEKTSKRYIEIDDMDSKIKKGFDLVLSVMSNKKITIQTIELTTQFLELYKDIIEKYDKENKQIYLDKFKKSLNTAIEIVNIHGSGFILKVE